VPGREYVWTDLGIGSAARHDVTPHEVVDALYSPQRIENAIGSALLAVAGLTETARVVVVLCERLGGETYAIAAARPANPEEIIQWLEGTR
jgi:hypothetical protein